VRGCYPRGASWRRLRRHEALINEQIHPLTQTIQSAPWHISLFPACHTDVGGKEQSCAFIAGTRPVTRQIQRRRSMKRVVRATRLGSMHEWDTSVSSFQLLELVETSTYLHPRSRVREGRVEKASTSAARGRQIQLSVCGKRRSLRRRIVSVKR
jgi:hypothetical protein